MTVRPATARLDYLIEHAHFVTFEAPEGAVMQYSRNEFRDLLAMYVREAAAIPPGAVLVTEESLAAALIGSDLIRRYQAYSHAAFPDTMRVESDTELARTWSPAILDALRERQG